MRLIKTKLSDAELYGQSPPAPLCFSASDHSRLNLSKSFYNNRDLSKGQTLNQHDAPHKNLSLYTPEQRARRDASRWTIVQAVLAPIQFFAFLISVCLVLRFLMTGEGLGAATISILIKTLLLFSIMVTGAIWEKVVFDRYLFAPAFYWEDVFSMLVIALHTAYCVALFGGYGTDDQKMAIALAAYSAYAINATQFLLKLRAARLDQARLDRASSAVGSASDLELAQ